MQKSSAEWVERAAASVTRASAAAVARHYDAGLLLRCSGCRKAVALPASVIGRSVDEDGQETLDVKGPGECSVCRCRLELVDSTVSHRDVPRAPEPVGDDEPVPEPGTEEGKKLAHAGERGTGRAFNVIAAIERLPSGEPGKCRGCGCACKHPVCEQCFRGLSPA